MIGYLKLICDTSLILLQDNIWTIRKFPTIIRCILNTTLHVCIFSCAEIGLGLVAFGLGFLLLGITLFFDKGLLAMGNVSTIHTLCIMFV